MDPKRRKLDINFKRCVICQKDGEQKLRQGSVQGQKSFLRVLKLRNDNVDCIEYNRVITVLKTNDLDELDICDSVTELLWHKNCFSAFTSSTNLSNLSGQSNKDDTLSSPSSSRAPRKAFNFIELCFFCCQKSYKKDKKLLLVSTFEFGETLKRRVEEQK